MKVLIIDAYDFGDFERAAGEHAPTVDFRKTVTDDRDVLRVRLPDHTPHALQDDLRDAFDLRPRLSREEVTFIEAFW